MFIAGSIFSKWVQSRTEEGGGYLMEGRGEGAGWGGGSWLCQPVESVGVWWWGGE